MKINFPSESRAVNAKWILDHHGPDALAHWVSEQPRVLITDTTMRFARLHVYDNIFRDAHQSLLATRVRTADLLNAAEETANVLHDAFSLEVLFFCKQQY